MVSPIEQGDVVVRNMLSKLSGPAKDCPPVLNKIILVFDPKDDSAPRPTLTSETYHLVLEALFTSTLNAQHTYLTSKAQNKQTHVLTKCARAVRAVVLSGVRIFKRKTTMAVVDHITQTLPRDGEMFEPLANDYLYALDAILAEQSQAERLVIPKGDKSHASHETRERVWDKCVDFCVDYLIKASAPQADPDSTTSQPTNTASSRVSRISQPDESKLKFFEVTWFVILFRCLWNLVRLRNAPIQAKSDDIMALAIQVLEAKGSLSQTSLLAFYMINRVLESVQADATGAANQWVAKLVPLVHHWWSGERLQRRDASIFGFRDEMIKFIYISHPHIEHQLMYPDEAGFYEQIDALSTMLWAEYARRGSGHAYVLRLDDLRFGVGHLPVRSMKTAHFCLLSHNTDTERPWANLECMAILEGLVSRYDASKRERTDLDQELPRKRRRIERQASRLLQRLRSTDPQWQFAALQFIPLLAARGLLPQDEIADLVSILTNMMVDEQPVTTSWAMIACASCVIEMKAGNDRELLRLVSHLAARSVTLPTVSRAACVLLEACLEAGLPWSDVAEDLNNIVTQNGPSLLTDSSVALMTRLFHLRNEKLPGASQSTCNNIIRWVFGRWVPDEMAFASAAKHIPLVGVVNLFRACCGQPPLERSPGKLPIGSLGSTRHSQIEKEHILRYLLLLGEGGEPARQLAAREKSLPAAPTTSADHLIPKKLMLELLWPKLQDLEQLCDSWAYPGAGLVRTDTAMPFSQERLDSALLTCLAAALMAPQLSSIKSAQSDNLCAMVCKIVETSLRVALLLGNDRSTANVVLSRVNQALPRIDAAALREMYENEKVLCSVLSVVGAAAETMNYGQKMIDDSDDADDRDYSAAAQHTIAFPRHPLDGGITTEAFNLATMMRLYLNSIMGADGTPIEHVPEIFVSKMVDDRSHENVLYRQEILLEVLGSDLVLDPTLAGRILFRLVAVIQSDEFEGSEYALTCCLEAMSLAKRFWVQADGELGDLTVHLYLHFNQKLREGGMLSPKSQCLLARVVMDVLSINDSYATQVEQKRRPYPPSPRTFLLALLSGPVVVKFSVGQRLADIFELYVLKLHDEVFLDILESLPRDPEDPEGMAFRLRVLSSMACRWPTLLRRCTYHIFETPGKTGRFVEYASICVAEISAALSLESPRKLFDLFASQVLYTWLEWDKLETMPYGVFGFSSLANLLHSGQSEALALMVMRGQESSISKLQDILGETCQVLVQRNLARIVAYSIADDERLPEDEKRHGDDWARRQLSRELYMTTIYQNFVDIISIFFIHVDSEEPMERYFETLHLEEARTAMAAMKSISHSEVRLPTLMQPQFRARFLVNQLLQMCGKTEFEFERLWRPPLVVAVARRLLNTVHPALGPLHACSVLRKLRVLIALAGSTAYTGYPLQMFLHSLRPFMLDTESADDAIGISQYLIASGQEQLMADPTFTAGYSLSTLASLRVFLESSQSSTTQESLFRATMDKAQQFHAWFSSWLERYTSPAFAGNDASHAAFQAITRSAAQIRSSGNATQGTAESDLLLHILRDGECDKPLLDKSARELALGMLCGDDFERPALLHDIVQNDDDAVGLASLVVESCRGEALSESYISWAGRVVGRSFAASGDVPGRLLRESKLGEYLGLASGSHGSENAILHRLGVLTGHRDSATAGMAESALRYVVSTSTTLQDAMLLEASMVSLPPQLVEASDWSRFSRIPAFDVPSAPRKADAGVFAPERIRDPDWLPSLTIPLLGSVPGSTILSVLSPLVETVRGFASDIFPFVVHLVLQAHAGMNLDVRQRLGAAMRGWFLVADTAPREHTELLINTVLFLRSQPYPGEKSIADRSGWLDVDYNAATKAASRCGMYKIALLFAEIAHEKAAANTTRSSRRSSIMPRLDVSDSVDTLLEIFENIDDPDAYYGLPEDSSLSGVLARLEHEGNAKALVFRGTQLNSHMRSRNPLVATDMQSMVKSLGSMAMAGVAHSLSQSLQEAGSINDTFQAARKLEIWNLPAPPSADNPTVTIYRTFQALSRAANVDAITDSVSHGLGHTMKRLTSGNLNAASIRDQLGALAVLTELDEVVQLANAQTIDSMCATFERRNRWMRHGRYEDVDRLLSCRETSLTMLGSQPVLLTHANLSMAEARKLQVQAMLQSSGVYRLQEARQESLDIATSLDDLIAPCQALGLNIDAAVKMEVAHALWDHKEMTPSISLLQNINAEALASKQTIPVDGAAVLSMIGHRTSVARLETPDEIQRNWLAPALKALKGKHAGSRAGLVFHQFAIFCDQQLHNEDSIEDLARLERLRAAKRDEVRSLEIAFQKTTFKSTQEAKYWRATHINRAEQWLKLDDDEVSRVHESREEFARLCLENYLLSLAASDEHDHDALRFTSLWIERSGEDFATATVRKRIEWVPTRKFAPIMNQLSSRLQNKDTAFQKTLLALVVQTCIDHPYHGMYQVWTGTRASVVKHDEVSVLRHQAMERVARRLMRAGGQTAATWTAIDRTSTKYADLAAEPAPQDSKARRHKVGFSQNKPFQILAAGVVKYQIPPPTMQIEVRADLDYSGVPRMAHLEATFSYAGGVSAPKIVTAIGTDGQRYKQLVKGSKNDDLRQDAIMEQVFGQVSALLKLNRKTQQRRLTIRTYKVLPLTATAGLIEFVPNTIPLHEWLMPAHERYHPKDLRQSDCRKQISDVDRLGVDARVKAFRAVTARFTPTMRYFFLEHYPDPDDWFVRRTAYTRTTAAISMLGHVLGVGDRHGHNILLDAKTGEVVHIDLGIAFEMGRVLPIPELVPFRLTRDIVDGMGITGVEGVFRRCCEFTLAALRAETEPIMSILDVLRYDPLYQWSISPARMQRLQDARRAAEEENGSVIQEAPAERKFSTVNPTMAKTLELGSMTTRRGKNHQQQQQQPAPALASSASTPGIEGAGEKAGDATEANRALEVVKRKLTQSLSVEATVYDLINQARDEKNLALLFTGWAAYA